MLGISSRWAGWRMAKMFWLGVACAVLAFFLYVWRLGTLVPGLSHNEVAARAASSSFNAIQNNPINAPHKLLQLLLQHLGHHGAFWMRSISVLFAVLFLFKLFLFLRMWFGGFSAVFGALLLAATPWYIILARSAVPDIMYFSPILVLYAYHSLSRAKTHQTFKWILLILAIAVVFYTPGGIWFLALSFAIGYKQFIKAIKKVPSTTAILGLALLLVLISPLIFELTRHSVLIKSWLLIPQHLPTVTVFAKSFAWSVLTLFLRARQHTDYTIGRLSILSITQIVLLLIGLYAMSKSARREVYGLISLFIISLLAAAANSSMLILTLCLPAAAILSSAGLRSLYVKWFRVFPLNPLAKFFALILISLLLIAQVGYGIRYGLIAWPHNVDTRKTYVLK